MVLSRAMVTISVSMTRLRGVWVGPLVLGILVLHLGVKRYARPFANPADAADSVVPGPR